MSFKCPHCGEELEVLKCSEITKSKPVAQTDTDLASGIVKATSEAIEEKVSQSSGKSAAIDSLMALNNLANGSLGQGGSGLAAGWSGSMLQTLKNRKEQLDQGGYSPEVLAKEDPENVNKDAAAKTVQNMIHGFLNKGE